jgi:uncharacterized membrane protein
MTDKRFETGDAIGYGWTAMKQNLGYFIVFCLIVLAASVVASRIIHFILPHFLENGVEWVANMILSMVVITVSLQVYDGREKKWLEAYASIAQAGNFVAGMFLYCVIIAGGFILLIVPGIVWAVQFSFAGYLMLDEKLDPVAALRRSSALTRGVRMELFLLALILIGINLLGVLALGVGIFATIPLSWMAWTWVYRLLQRESAPAAGEAQA